MSDKQNGVKRVSICEEIAARLRALKPEDLVASSEVPGKKDTYAGIADDDLQRVTTLEGLVVDSYNKAVDEGNKLLFEVEGYDPNEGPLDVSKLLAEGRIDDELAKKLIDITVKQYIASLWVNMIETMQHLEVIRQFPEIRDKRFYSVIAGWKVFWSNEPADPEYGTVE